MNQESAGRSQRAGVRIVGLLLAFFLSAVRCPLSAEAAEPFFVTIQKVELKSAAGEWITVIEPDKKVDLAQSEPSVSFFNNGRVVPGRYVNVRVQLLNDDRVGATRRVARTQTMAITRRENYGPPLLLKKNSFINISFKFDLKNDSQNLSNENIKQIQVVVDEDERTDGPDTITIGG